LVRKEALMRIEVRSANVPVSESLRRHVLRKLDFALRRYETRVERLVVRLADLNGPRGGVDKRCRILARLASGSVVVEATDGDAYVAVSQAALRLDERVAREIERRRGRSLTRRRGPRRRWLAAVDVAAAHEGPAREGPARP